ncbi:MAG: hypothetical protein R3F37_00070 [Candidatus Competibacteraceae bacterium]
MRDEMNPSRKVVRLAKNGPEARLTQLPAAALPNKFVAIVPANQAAKLAEEITGKVRRWTQKKANAALDHLLAKAGSTIPDVSQARDQIKKQLTDFPEVHWAAVPWSLAVEKQGQAPDTSSLKETLGQFYPQKLENAPGFLGDKAWQLLSKELKLPDGTQFFNPNAGVLYPALYDLLDKTQAATKSVREFKQLPQEGYRCSLCGEREWLTTDSNQLTLPPGERKKCDTLWTVVAERKPSWARKGEHLCAPCTLKRFWPTLFVNEIDDVLKRKQSRYVVSTHVMALATTFDRWLSGEQGNVQPMHEDVLTLSGKLQSFDSAALPKRLADTLRRQGFSDPVRDIVERLPTYLDFVKENDSAITGEDELGEHRKLIERVLGAKPETYYGMIMMDGDSMGAWLSGQGEKGESYLLPFENTWHPKVREKSRIAIRVAI